MVCDPIFSCSRVILFPMQRIWGTLLVFSPILNFYYSGLWLHPLVAFSRHSFFLLKLWSEKPEISQDYIISKLERDKFPVYIENPSQTPSSLEFNSKTNTSSPNKYLQESSKRKKRKAKKIFQDPSRGAPILTLKTLRLLRFPVLLSRKAKEPVPLIL